jgi:hypothetical protein
MAVAVGVAVAVIVVAVGLDRGGIVMLLFLLVFSLCVVLPFNPLRRPLVALITA